MHSWLLVHACAHNGLPFCFNCISSSTTRQWYLQIRSYWQCTVQWDNTPHLWRPPLRLSEVQQWVHALHTQNGTIVIAASQWKVVMGSLCCSIIHIHSRDTTHCASAEHTLSMGQYVWVKYNTTDANTMAALQAFYHALVHTYTHTHKHTHSSLVGLEGATATVWTCGLNTPVGCTQNDRHNTEN